MAVAKTQTCRECLYFSSRRLECLEWHKTVRPDATCARFQDAGAEAPVVDATRDGGSIIWLKNERGNRRPRAQDQFITLPPETSRGNLRISNALGARFAAESERVAIGIVPKAQEIWLRRDPKGPFKVSRSTERKFRSIGGPAFTERMRQAGMKPGRYYLDETRSGDKLMVFVWREAADKRSRYQ